VVKRVFWLALLAVLVASAAVGFYVQASSSGLPGGLFGWRWPWRAEVRLTATPTKTPAAPPMATATSTALLPLPTVTSSATPTERPPVSARPTVPPPTSTPRPPLAEKLVRLAREHGFDPAGRFVVVDQNLQRLHVVEDGVEARTLPVSTGDPDNHFHTPAWSGVIGEFWGSFSAHGVWADNAWYLFDQGGTFLIHSAPYVLQDGVKVYQQLDAVGLYPASRGCIRLLPEDAQWFTDWQPQGVPIIILHWDGGSSRQG